MTSAADTVGEVIDRGDDYTPQADLEKLTDSAEDASEVSTEAEASVEADSGKDEAKDKVKDKAKDTRVPLARHKEILAKEREQRAALERELAALKTGSEVAKTNENITEAENKVLSMEKEYLDLLAKGEVEKAAAKMAEIRRTERSIVQAEAQLQTQAAEARAYERVKYDTTVERLEAAYPAINPDHDDFDKEVTSEVLELMGGYVATGRYSRAEALQKACKMVLGTTTRKQENATETDVRVSKEDVNKQVAADRKKAQVEKNLDAAVKQPPNSNAVGRNSDAGGGVLKATDIVNMSQRDFAKLSDSDLAKLRGDAI
jgi:hypothetical protein